MQSTQPIRDVINTRELTKDYYQQIIGMAQDFYNAILAGDSRNYRHLLDGWNVVPIFSQESTRTHDSFIGALVKMGARQDIGISDPKASSLEKGESLADTIDTYVGYGAHFVVMRDGREGSAHWARTAALRSYSRRLRDFAAKHRHPPKNMVLPIIFNGGDGSHNHPSQHLLDCAAMQYYFDRFDDMNVGIINDLGASRVFASQVDAAAMLGWNLHLYALPGAEIRPRELKRLGDTSASPMIYREFGNFLAALPLLDVLYVHRFQKNLRGGQALDTKCDPITLDVLEKYGFDKHSKVMHARPIDKSIKEIDDSLRWHDWNGSDVQSDFGIPARMAMAYYAIKNGLFSFEGVVRSVNPDAFAYRKNDLSDMPTTEKVATDYTTAYINRGYVIDHIPRGCGTMMQSLAERLLPDATIVLASNVHGKSDRSNPKDVIKIHSNSELPYELANAVALLTDPYAERSCRVSKFVDGKRVEKWEYKERASDGGNCGNDKCITNPKYGEGISPSIGKRSDQAYECTFCHTIQ